MTEEQIDELDTIHTELTHVSMRLLRVARQVQTDGDPRAKRLKATWRALEDMAIALSDLLDNARWSESRKLYYSMIRNDAEFWGNGK